MRNIAIVALLLALACATGVAQFELLTDHNAYVTKTTWTGPDSTMPYRNDQGVRRVFVTDDLDKDGKLELLATDYANGGRVHAWELNTTTNKLELVWSSPRLYSTNPNSTPRWIQTGDLDADGNKEIIFPIGPRYTGSLCVYEYNGTDNGYGASGMADLTLPSAQFTPTLGATANFRMDREAGSVYDFDGDGRDEVIMACQDGKVYILGVVGDIGGFGSWAVEGGDPAVNPDNKFSAGSWWHSFPADIDGDSKQEIVNHYWNYWGYWSIDPVGPDSYRYPTPSIDSATNEKAKTQFYHEYMRDRATDACSYMGMFPADVDGDGKDELPGIIYSGASDVEYYLSLTSLSKSDTGVYVWKDSTQFGLIGQKLWEKAGKTAGSHWGIDSYDFDANGKDEIYVGGSADYNIIQVTYNGSGSLLDAANYTSTILYPGDAAFYHEWTYYDSLGVIDTTRAESPFVSGLFAGGDMDGDGKKELAVVYQSVADSITHAYWHWDTTGIVAVMTLDSTVKVRNQNVITIRVLEYTGVTGFKDEGLFTLGLPEEYTLDQNYPNPFNPSTEIRFSLPAETKISLTVYDMLGKEVKSLLADQECASGTHTIAWDGTNNSGTSVASGSYIYTLQAGSVQKSAKMMLVR